MKAPRHNGELLFMMLPKKFATLVSFFVSLAPLPTYANDLARPIIVATNSLACVETTVVSVRARQYSRDMNGKRVLTTAGFGMVTFASYLGEENVLRDRPHATVTIAEQPGADVAAAERPEDRVRLCLLSMPVRQGRCDPEYDPRGREYRVWDYRQHAAYVGSTGGHDCGGA
jgi:hypothetical protein